LLDEGVIIPLQREEYQGDDSSPDGNGIDDPYETEDELDEFGEPRWGNPPRGNPLN